MSNIYIQEPQTTGKIVLVTTVGDIDIELWTRECPLTCRNFIQLCLEGYYNKTIFHRVVKNFIVQGGDPNGDGTGGESIYGKPFKDEFHSRLRYTRRGLVGMANSEKDDNGSQFFFTMGSTPELQNKNTLFGKVTGDTIYNMIKIQEGLVDHNERPIYPQSILHAVVLLNPFDDIIPRLPKTTQKLNTPKRIEKGVKNFALLSFGVEAEVDEGETSVYVRKSTRSMEDSAISKNFFVADKFLNKQTNTFEQGNSNCNKNNQKKTQTTKCAQLKMTEKECSDSEPDDVILNLPHVEHLNKEIIKKKLRQEMIDLKKDYHRKRKRKIGVSERNEKDDAANGKEEYNSSDLLRNYSEERKKYQSICSKLSSKGTSREDFTLSLLSNFRSQLNNTKLGYRDVNKLVKQGQIEIQSRDWMDHKLVFQVQQNVVAKDASTKGDDWYDVYDPRNPLNKRKRYENPQSKEKQKS